MNNEEADNSTQELAEIVAEEILHVLQDAVNQLVAQESSKDVNGTEINQLNESNFATTEKDSANSTHYDITYLKTTF